jgi:hypothetical protein
MLTGSVGSKSPEVPQELEITLIGAANACWLLIA